MKKHLSILLPIAVLTAIFSGCSSEPEWVAVYEDCKSNIDAAAAEMKSNSAESDKNNPMAEVMGNMVASMGMAACESIKQVCENDPEGGVCQAIIAETKKAQAKNSQ